MAYGISLFRRQGYSNAQLLYMNCFPPKTVTPTSPLTNQARENTFLPGGAGFFQYNICEHKNLANEGFAAPLFKSPGSCGGPRWSVGFWATFRHYYFYYISIIILILGLTAITYKALVSCQIKSDFKFNFVSSHKSARSYNIKYVEISRNKIQWKTKEHFFLQLISNNSNKNKSGQH